jgi:hypothetical protein
LSFLGHFVNHALVWEKLDLVVNVYFILYFV